MAISMFRLKTVRECLLLFLCVLKEHLIDTLTRSFINALQEAQVYAQEYGLFFIETSAKTATNVNDIFHEIGMG